jgi:hypothetical protein
MYMILAVVGLLLGLMPPSYSYDEPPGLATFSSNSRKQLIAPGDGLGISSEQPGVRSDPATAIRHSFVPDAELVATVTAYSSAQFKPHILQILEDAGATG